MAAKASAATRWAPGSPVPSNAASPGTASEDFNKPSASAAFTCAAAGGDYPSTRWQPFDVVRDWQSFPVPVDLASGVYRLVVALAPVQFDAFGARSDTASPSAHPSWFNLGEIQVEGRPRRFQLPGTMQHTLQTDFAHQIRALGYDLEPSHVGADRRLRLTR